ncbi:MAG TPA: trehalose-phosphatase [Gemmataceae bacterium]|nr:trehalose-phosphatase [Gemmataceae bacterium]
MTSNFFPAMRPLEDQVQRAGHVLFALDYDGTLTPIVEDPMHAVLPPPTRELLGSLARFKDVSVAIMSGRIIKDLRELVALNELIYVGNHGVEIEGPRFRFTEPAASVAAPELHQLGIDLAEILSHIPGAVVEDKGLSIGIHHRQVAPVDAEEVWQRVLRAIDPIKDRLQLTAGAKIYEIRPRVSWNKGDTVNWIRNRLELPNTLVIYAGDDITDEDAFAVLGNDAVTIKVGDSAATTTAQYLLPSPAEVHGFLHWMHDMIEEKTSKK